MNKLLAQVNTTIAPPDFLGDPKRLTLGNILGWGLRMVFVVAGLFVFYNLIMGALEWIQSGGDKEKVDKARKKITTTIIGLIILFVVIGGIVLLEQVFGVGLGFTQPIVIKRFAETG